jgi:hypothetical protein
LQQVAAIGACSPYFAAASLRRTLRRPVEITFMVQVYDWEIAGRVGRDGQGGGATRVQVLHPSGEDGCKPQVPGAPPSASVASRPSSSPDFQSLGAGPIDNCTPAGARA